MGDLNNLYEFRIKNDEGEILKMTFLTENIRQAIALFYICTNTTSFTGIRRTKKWMNKGYTTFLSSQTTQ